jgi:transposase
VAARSGDEAGIRGEEESLGRATRRRFSAEEKTRVVPEGLRGEDGIAEPCRREGIAISMVEA